MLIYLQMIESDLEKDKFEQLYLKYRNLMYHSAFTILHNREDSEDSVHQAFVSIIDNLDKIGDTNSAETRSFCVLCCRNKALDLYRRKNRWGEIELFENIQELPMPEPESQLDAAIAGLPLALGTVILLHYDNGYSIEEIAEILNISVSAARKRLTRAKAMLKKILREEGMMK